MSRLRFACAVFAAAALSGCSMIPTYHRPDAPVPGNWLYDAPQGAASTGDFARLDRGQAGALPQNTPASALNWQDFFAQQQLRELIATALRNNRDLRVAVLNIEQARAQYDIRNADRYPSIGGAVTASRAPAQGTGKETSTYTVGLALSAWEIDFFGRLASLSQAALAQYLATEEGRKAAQISLVSSVATTWLSLVADQDLLAVTRQTLQTREESLRLTKLRFDNGVSSELDFRQAQSLAESARVALAQQQRQLALDANALSLLVGQPVTPDIAGSGGIAGLTLPDVPAGLPSEVLVRRPDVQQAEQQLIAANANIGAARAAFFPRITLTAAAGTASSALSGLFKSGSWAYTAAPSLLQPIFDAGRNAANLRSAQVGRDIAVAQYERAIQSAFREVSDALAGRTTLAEQVRAQDNVTEAETVRLRLSTLRYDNGVASYLELLDAQRSLFTARQQQVQTRLQLLQNQVLLYRSLGGGWSDMTPVAAP